MGNRKLSLPELHFNRSITTLQKFCNLPSNVVDDSINGNVNVATIAFYIGGYLNEFNVHADCKTSA